jgi:Asp-tRNA(Asn)/Glu-tRNA(Gln) amidotransferase A subunit family amidase
MPDEKPFSLEEATIDELREAIEAGPTTCVAVVQHYIDRARAYYGVCSVLVTEDGASVRRGPVKRPSSRGAETCGQFSEIIVAII